MPLTPDQAVVATRLTPRKARLLAIALARHHWHQLSDAGRGAVLVAERHADGLADAALFAAFTAADKAHQQSGEVVAETAVCACWPEIEDPREYVRSYVLEVAEDLRTDPPLMLGGSCACWARR